jgi:PAS domain S-box-containing protein
MTEVPFPLPYLHYEPSKQARLRAAESREELLEDAVTYLRLLLESTDEGIVGIDLEGRCLFANSAAERLLGEGRAQLIGAPIAERLGNATDTDEYELRRGDGVVVTAGMRTNPIVIDGEVHGSVVSLSDISMWRRAEQYLETQRAVAAVLADSATADEAIPRVLAALGETIAWCEFAAFWASTDDGVLRCSSQWLRPEVASEFAEFAELSRTSMLREGRGLPGRAHALRHPTWLSIAEALANRTAYTRAEAGSRIRLKGGVAFPIVAGGGVLGVIELFGRQLGAPDEELMQTMCALGAPLGHFLERKRAESEAERLKDEFMSLVSHELRTPLSSVLGYLELLEREEVGPLTDDQRRCLSTIGRNANRLLRLVGDLLLVARLEAGDLPLELSSVSLAGAGADAVDSARPLARDRGIELLLEQETDPVVRGDRGRLAQVIDNLVSNALKFTERGGTATVRVAVRDGRALLEVSDTGMGIPADDREQVFQPFFRTSGARTRAVQGTGLGLAITRALVDAHGGSVSCQSKEGVGTTFSVELPLAAPILVPVGADTEGARS